MHEVARHFLSHLIHATYFHSQIGFISMGRIKQSFEGLACRVLQSFSCTGVQNADLSCIRMSVKAYLDYLMCLFNTDICFLNSELLSDGEKTICTDGGENSLTAVTVKTISSNTGLVLPVS